MKKIGIVGGIGWRSTVEYYSEICRRADECHAEMKQTGAPSTPEIAIESLDVARSVALHGRDGDDESWHGFDEYHRGAFRRLEAAGAEVAVMASNTPHHRFDEIVRGLGMQTISLLDAAAGECARIGARRVLILGWPLTMRSQKFREAFGKHGVELSGPKDEAAREKTIELIAELERGREKGAAENREGELGFSAGAGSMSCLHTAAAGISGVHGTAVVQIWRSDVREHVVGAHRRSAEGCGDSAAEVCRDSTRESKPGREGMQGRAGTLIRMSF
jgi:aspartate racemase